MKKGISKFLSIVLSAAMVSPMVGMNPANAMVSSEDAAGSTSTTKPASEVIRLERVIWSEEESLKIFNEFCGYACNLLIMDANGKFIIENCISVAISKLNNFLKENSCPTLQDLRSEIIDKMVAHTFHNACVLDTKLRFLDSLMIILEELIFEKSFSLSEDINNSLRGFCCYIQSMVIFINATLIRNSTVVDLICANLNQGDALGSWLKSMNIESREWCKFKIEREQKSKKDH